MGVGGEGWETQEGGGSEADVAVQNDLTLK